MKTWYTSKTIWINLLAAIALIAQSQYGYVIDPETQAVLLGFVNLVLRVVTKQPINWGNSPTAPLEGQDGFTNLRQLCGLFLVSLLVATLFTACATSGITPATGDTPTQTAGKSLLAAKSTIVASATAADGLCRSGVLPHDKCSQAKLAYETAKLSYDTAVDAYLLMATQGGDPAGFAQALIRLQDLANHMLQLTGGVK